MLIIPAIIGTFRRLGDRSYRITIETGELAPDKVAGLALHCQKVGYFAFKEDVFKQEEIDTLDGLEADYDDTGKTKSQRLRSTLYLRWKSDDMGFKSFQHFYDYRYEQYINHEKKYIDK